MGIHPGRFRHPPTLQKELLKAAGKIVMIFCMNGKFLSISIIWIGLMWALCGRAEVEHTLLRRIAVFPIAESNSSKSEDAWWQMRELLTKDQRFLVASRRFMINRGVFQPRKNLKPADAIILAKILDAQALVTSWIEDRAMNMKIFDGENGYLLWEGHVDFHPALPINDQLLKVSLQLMSDFVLALPYQGYQVLDEVIGKPVYEKDSHRLAQVFAGVGTGIQIGDPVQWLTVSGDTGQAFLSAPRVTVIAEGRVVSVLGDRFEIELQKIRDLGDLKINSLVRFPKEVARLKTIYASPGKESNLSAEFLSAEIKDASEFNRDTHPTATALAFIFNIAGFLLLAF